MDYNEFNFLLDKLKYDMYALLEESKLPIGAIFYLMKDIYNNLNNQYIASINNYTSENVTQTTKEISLDESSKEQN